MRVASSLVHRSTKRNTARHQFIKSFREQRRGVVVDGPPCGDDRANSHSYEFGRDVGCQSVVVGLLLYAVLDSAEVATVNKYEFRNLAHVCNFSRREKDTVSDDHSRHFVRTARITIYAVSSKMKNPVRFCVQSDHHFLRHRTNVFRDLKTTS